MRFQDPLGRYGASLPLQDRAALRYVFPHVVNGLGYFVLWFFPCGPV